MLGPVKSAHRRAARSMATQARPRMRKSVAGLLGVFCLIAVACSASDSNGGGEDGSGGPADHATGAPLLEIDSDMTWRSLVDSIAGEDELECIDGVLGDELPSELLNGPVIDPGGWPQWPVWGKEVLTVDLGADRWPHDLWRCMSPPSATAVYLSVYMQETYAAGLLQRDEIGIDDGECISKLPEDRTLSQSAERVLGSEQSFDTTGLAEFLAELDELTESRLFWCLSDSMTWSFAYVIDEFFDGELSTSELDCMTQAAVDALREANFDREDFYRALTADEFDAESFVQRYTASLAGEDTCLPADDAQNGGGQQDGGQGSGDAEDFAGRTAVWEGTVDTDWGDLLARYSGAERACISDSIGIETVEALGGISLVLSVEFDETDKRIPGIFGCLGFESAAYTTVAVLAAEGAAEGLLIEPSGDECLRAAFSEFDVAAFWLAGFDGDDRFWELFDSAAAAIERCLPSEWAAWWRGEDASSQAEPLEQAQVPWETETTDTVVISPTVLDGVVIATGYSNVVWALDASSGDVLWTFGSDSEIAVPSQVGEGVVLAGSGEAQFGLDVLTGDVVWESPAGERWHGPVALAGRIGFYSADGRGPSSAVVAIDTATGARLWRSEMRTSDLPLLFPLMVNADRVYVSDDRTMHALDSDTGTIVWSAEIAPGVTPTVTDGIVAVMGTVDPATLDESETAMPRSCLPGSTADYCSVVRHANSGELLWFWEHPHAVLGHSVLDGRPDGAVLLADEDYLHAFDARWGESVWAWSYGSVSDRPYDADGTIFFTDLWAGVVAIDTPPGTELWTLPGIDASSGTMVLDRGVLYAASSQQEIHAIDAATGELLRTSPAVFHSANQRVFAVDNGIVFVGFQDGGRVGVRALVAPSAGPPVSDDE